MCLVRAHALARKLAQDVEGRVLLGSAAGVRFQRALRLAPGLTVAVAANELALKGLEERLVRLEQTECALGGLMHRRSHDVCTRGRTIRGDTQIYRAAALPAARTRAVPCGLGAHGRAAKGPRRTRTQGALQLLPVLTKPIEVRPVRELALPGHGARLGVARDAQQAASLQAQRSGHAQRGGGRSENTFTIYNSVYDNLSLCRDARIALAHRGRAQSPKPIQHRECALHRHGTYAVTQ